SSQLTDGQTLAAMRRFAERTVELAPRFLQAGHPLEIMHEFAAGYPALAADVAREQALAEPMPKLAQLVAASPLDAAVHDAYGKALRRNAYQLLGPEFANHDLAVYLNADFAG